MVLPRPCIACGRPGVTTGSHCTNCATTRQRDRGSSAARGYDHAWRKVRRFVLARDNWVCQLRRPGCLGRATTVDHVVSLARGGARLDPDNLQASCLPCNSGKGGR